MLIILSFLMAGACKEEAVEEDPFSPAEKPSTKMPIIESLTFGSSGFSDYIEVSSDKKYFRFAFDFFPEGSGFNFEDKTVSVPCTFLLTRIPEDLPEGVDIQLSAPLEEDCESNYTIKFDSVDEFFTLKGIVAKMNSSYDRFADDFEIIISLDGVKDASDNTSLSSDGDKLEDFYDLILERRLEE